MRRDERVNDVVLFQVADESPAHAQIVALDGSTLAHIRILGGPRAGEEIERVPWGVIHVADHRGEYRGWVIQVIPYVRDGGFGARGYRRNSVASVSGLPVQISFDTQQPQPTEQAAIEAGFDWAKRKIDESR